MGIDVEHILDCLDQYGKGELTEKQLARVLIYDEKKFLIKHPGLQEVDNNREEEFDVLDWLGEEELFFMIVEVNESLCRQAESVLIEIGVEMSDTVENFLKQLFETKQHTIVVSD